MKSFLIAIAVATMSLTAHSQQYLNAANGNLGSAPKVKCMGGLYCEKASSGVIEIKVNKVTTASGALTVTAAQCGTTFLATGAVSATLPAVSTVPGCEYDFVASTAASTDVNPADADLILNATNASGDATQIGGAAGRHIKLKALSSGFWEVVSSLGTILDIN